nr:NADH dehydrogenase subunit 2 [Spilopyra sumptuosa]
MFKYYKILFFNSMILGSLLAISSYSWFSMWAGLEINLLSIIPLLNDSKSLYPTESALKYFISQALASAIFLFSIMMILNFKEIFFLKTNLLIFYSSLLIKMGAAPFHFWFPEVIEGLNWMNCLIILTWQKVAPLTILLNFFKSSMFFISVIIFSALIGGILGFNQISMRKILAYSSINHMAWMISSMFSFNYIWFIYFTIYSMISINIILILNKFLIYKINQIPSISKKKLMFFFYMLNFLSLGGLPPFLGFFPKWLVIHFLNINNQMILGIILIICTLLTIYFYLRLTFFGLTFFYSMTNKNFIDIPFIFIWSNFLSLSGLIFSTFLFNLS